MCYFYEAGTAKVAYFRRANAGTMIGPVVYIHEDTSSTPHAAGILEVRSDNAGNTPIQTWYSGSTERGSFDTDGDFQCDGSVTKGGGGFLIDHPLDPENKLLQHSFVESPEMRTAYFGQTQTINKKVTIILPEWFQALNGTDKTEYNYQLTPIGKQADCWISKEITDNEFEISCDVDCKVSWMVTAIRHDVWAQNNRLFVEIDKAEPAEAKDVLPDKYMKGNYLHKPEHDGTKQQRRLVSLKFKEVGA